MEFSQFFLKLIGTTVFAAHEFATQSYTFKCVDLKKKSELLPFSPIFDCAKHSETPRDVIDQLVG